MNLRYCIGALLLLAGILVMGVSMLGIYRFKYVLNRMHAAAITDTLGILLVMLGLVVIRGLSFASAKLLLILILLWVTSPICTNRLAHGEFAASEDYRSYCEVEEE